MRDFEDILGGHGLKFFFKLSLYLGFKYVNKYLNYQVTSYFLMFLNELMKNNNYCIMKI
jgi:hypothetical protein